jgi:hypothetical protein
MVVLFNCGLANMLPSLMLIAISVFQAALCSAACSRPVLQSALDDLFKTIEKNKEPSLKVASSVKLTKNAISIKSINEAGFGNFTRWAKPFRITVLDEATCNVAAMSLPKYNNNTQILSTRMAVSPLGETTELEIFVTGGDTNYIFFGDSLPESPGKFWSESDPAPRNQLLKNMDDYPSAITAGDGNLVAVWPNCTRYENGFRIGPGTGGVGIPFGGCNTGFALIKVPVV